MKLDLQTCIILCFLILTASCKQKDSGKTSDKIINEPVKADSSSQAEEQPGKKLYELNCLTCHMADGSGVPGMYPPLIRTEIVLGPENELIKTVLFGLEGPVVVKGKNYNQLMPAQEHLSDRQIADILNYVRENWGSSGNAIDPAQVEKIRKQGKQSK